MSADGGLNRMRAAARSRGLLGQLVAILLLTLVIELGASTLLYERAGRVTVRADEAHRLAEHLAIVRKLVSARPRPERGALAAAMANEHYDLFWAPDLPSPPPLAPDLAAMRRQIVAWEPTLAPADLRLRLTSPGPHGRVRGGLRLADGSWLMFRTHELVTAWDLALGRLALAVIPALGLLLLGALLVRHALHPLRQLARAADRIGTGTAVEPVAEGGTIEVRHLVRTFNAMGDRIHRLLDERTEALAAVGHDLRTPLARLRLRLENGADRAALERDVAEMEAMVGSLLAFLGGEDDPEAAQRVDLAVLAQTVTDDAADRGAPASYAGPDHLEATVRPVAIRRALTNLVENAIHYGGGARVGIARTRAGGVRCTVDDDGPGIPVERLAEVLRPFTRLDSSRSRDTSGLGLGLAIVARAVELERGTLTLANRPEGGLRAEFVLPAC